MTTEQEPPVASRPAPNPSSISAPFWHAARAHRLQLQHCGHCDRYIYYPRPFCPACLQSDLTWRDVSGRGTVYTFTVVRRAASARFQALVPYVHAIVELEEGPRMTTNIVGCAPESVRIGMPVRAVYEDLDDTIAIVLFEPAG